MVVPLKAEGDKAASLSLPKFIATNFDLTGDHLLKTQIELHANEHGQELKDGRQPRRTKGYIRDSNATAIGEFEPHLDRRATSKNGTNRSIGQNCYQMEQQDLKIRELKARKNASKNKPQEQVVVMIDGSKGIQTQFENLRKVMAMKAATPRTSWTRCQEKDQDHPGQICC